MDGKNISTVVSLSKLVWITHQSPTSISANTEGNLKCTVVIWKHPRSGGLEAETVSWMLGSLGYLNAFSTMGWLCWHFWLWRHKRCTTTSCLVTGLWYHLPPGVWHDLPNIEFTGHKQTEMSCLTQPYPHCRARTLEYLKSLHCGILLMDVVWEIQIWCPQVDPFQSRFCTPRSDVHYAHRKWIAFKMRLHSARFDSLLPSSADMKFDPLIGTYLFSDLLVSWWHSTIDSP